MPFVFQCGQITPQLALKVLLQFDTAINNALATRVKNRINIKVTISPIGRSVAVNNNLGHIVSELGLHTAKGEAVRYHNRYRRNDTVFYRYCYRYLELR